MALRPLRVHSLRGAGGCLGRALASSVRGRRGSPAPRSGPRRAPGALVLLALLWAGACAPLKEGPEPPRASGSTVVRGRELTLGLPLLEALEQQVQGLRVLRSTDGCPVVAVRGRPSDRSPGAAVYVDGTRMRDTCILQQLRPAEVERVELLPVSATPPPGYRMEPGGLILVFRVR